MQKSRMIIFLIILLCCVTEFSNAQFEVFTQDLEFTITLQTGRELAPADYIILEYHEPASSGGGQKVISISIDYYVEIDKVEIHRDIDLHKVESIEFIGNKEKSSIEQIKINLWDGSKVIYKKLIDADDLVEEISADGEKKTFKSTGFFCIKSPNEEKPWYLSHVTASSDGKTFRNYYYKIKKIKFQETSKTKGVE